MRLYSRNALRIITCYRDCNAWVFDDPDVGLSREPFVAGVPEILDLLRAEHGITGEMFNITFAAIPFPGYHAKARWESEEDGGNWYWIEIDGETLTGWLCPALLKYFPTAPKKLYVQVSPG